MPRIWDVGRGKATTMNHANRSCMFLVVLVWVLLVASGCHGPAAESSRDEGLPSAEQMALDYRKALTEANRVPTMANAITRAVEKMKGQELFTKWPEDWGQYDYWRSCYRHYYAPINSEMPSELQSFITKIVGESKSALAEIRKARSLPPGLLPVEVPFGTPADTTYLNGVYAITERLKLGAALLCAQGHSQAAWQNILDIIAVNRVRGETPSVRTRGLCVACSQTICDKALLIVINGAFSADELQRMAQELPELDVYALLDAYATACVILEVREADAIIADRDNVAEAIIKGYEILRAYGVTDCEPPSIEALRQEAPAHRAAMLQYYKNYKAARTSGAPIPSPPARDGSYLSSYDLEEDWSRLREVVVWQRSAKALIEVLAFKARHSRFPEADETDLPENPFRPGVKMTYLHRDVDEESAEVSVSVPWPHELPFSKYYPEQGKPSPIGYKLVLPK